MSNHTMAAASSTKGVTLDGTEVCILCHTVSPYHAARFSALAERLPGFVVLQLSGEQKLYPWANAAEGAGARVETLLSRPLEEVPGPEQAAGVTRFLEMTRPAVVVSVGYAQPSMRAATQWARRNGAASLMVTDTWRGDKRRRWLKESAKRLWCSRMYDALFIPGARHASYFASLGVPESRVWRGVSVVDNAHFAAGAERARAAGGALREDLHLPERYFLCAARHAPEKNLERLLLAFGRYRRSGGEWDLVLLGSGPQEKDLHAIAARETAGGVHFAGWRQYPDLPAFHGLASAFILPSISEPWGLVVNEAMAAGLPVLVSRQCGCLPELCWRGINGDDFDPWDVEAMARLMLRCSGGEMDILAMGEASRRIIANFTPETWARAMRDCIVRTVEERRCA